MLNKLLILDKLKELDFPKDDYCVMTGAALVLYGVRQETADIDIGCTHRLFEDLLKKGCKLTQGKAYNGIVVDECIEIFENWMPQKKAFLHNIPVADLYDIRSYKEQLSREKDLRDIELIDRFLGKKQI